MNQHYRLSSCWCWCFQACHSFAVIGCHRLNCRVFIIDYTGFLYRTSRPRVNNSSSFPLVINLNFAPLFIIFVWYYHIKNDQLPADCRWFYSGDANNFGVEVLSMMCSFWWVDRFQRWFFFFFGFSFNMNFVQKNSRYLDGNRRRHNFESSLFYL